MGLSPDRESLAVQVYDALKEEIVSLRRAPGDRLVERELAADYGVSRIPLREALRRLEAEGLVVIVPRQGAMVAPFTVADVRHLFDVRESVEVLAARLAAARADVPALRAAQAQLRAAEAAVEAGDDTALAAANSAFHVCILELSGNPLLQAMMAPVNARVRWLFHLTGGLDSALEVCGEHERLYRAIAAGDAGLAARLAHAHVISSRDEAVQMAAGWSVTDLDPVEITRPRPRDRASRSTPLPARP